MKNKIYIFLTGTIFRVGGTQLYIKAKRDYLIHNGWIVYICYFDKSGEMLIEDLFPNSIYIPYLTIPSYNLFNFHRKHIIQKINSFIPKSSNEYVFESSCFYTASWGEILSREYSGRHIFFNLREISVCPKSMIDYIRFKVNRNEYAGISKDCSYQLLHPIIPQKTSFPWLPAYESNCISDVEYYGINIKNPSAFTIGIFGRISKNYVQGTVFEIIQFVREHHETLFNIIYIGGGDANGMKQYKKKLLSLYKKESNVDVYFTDNIFPVPRKLIKKINVCISGSGAAFFMAAEGIPTISVDPRDTLVNGFLCVDTYESIYSNMVNYQKQTVSNALNDVWRNPEKYRPPVFSLEIDFKPHDDFLHNCTKDLKYNTLFLNTNSVKLFFVRLTFWIIPFPVMLILYKISLIKSVSRRLLKNK